MQPAIAIENGIKPKIEPYATVNITVTMQTLVYAETYDEQHEKSSNESKKYI